MSEGLDAQRAALRRRQGQGARYDAETAPSRELDWARRGTAYFARLLKSLDDDALRKPSGIDGCLRRDVVTHIGYHARALSDIVSCARRDQTTLPGCALVDPHTVLRQSTQPPRALRNLFAHSVVHLNVEWRDLDAPQWDQVIGDAGGHKYAVRNTPWLRARAIWLHAIDLDAGGRLSDAPSDFLEKLGREDTVGSPSLANL